MRTRILIVCAALAVLTLSFSSCKKDKKEEGASTEVKLTLDKESKEITVMVGKTAQIKYLVKPKDVKPTFESANADIATVSDAGLVTGVAAGETVIKVKAGSVTKEAKVKVMGANDIDDSRLLGKTLPQGFEKMRESFAPFYAPLFDKMKEQESIVKAANEKEGWEFFRWKGQQEKLNAQAYTCGVKWVEKGKPADGRMIGQLVYGHSIGKRPVIIAFFLQYEEITFDHDPITNPKDGKMTKDMQLCGVILRAYGFTESPTVTQYVDKDKKPLNYALIQTNAALKLRAIISGNKGEDGKYTLYVEIDDQVEPQKQSSLRSAELEQRIRPNFEDFAIQH